MTTKTRKKEPTVELSTLKLNVRNPRRISDLSFELLCRSIRRDPKFMELRPIVVDDDGVILGGNQRYRACLEIGRKRVPESWVVRASELSEEQRRRFVLVDNAPEGMAGYWEWDLRQRDYDLRELEAVGFSMPERIDFQKAWTRMPDSGDPEGKAVRKLRVHFKSRAAVRRFAKVLGVEVNEATRRIWYPVS